MNISITAIEIEAFKNFAGRATLNLCPLAPGLHRVAGENRTNDRLGSNGCLVGTTLIDCPRNLLKYPKGVPIKELVGKSFLTYSWDKKKDTVVLSRVKRVWRTGRKKVYKVKLTAYFNNKKSLGNRSGGCYQGKFLPPCELVGTYDHPVMLCDGSWRKLGELRSGDSIKSLYRMDADRGKIHWSRTVATVQQDVGWQKNVANPPTYWGLTVAVSEQQFVCRAVNGDRPANAHAHHKDHNKYNHSPENLEWKDALKHASDHLKHRRAIGPTGWEVTGVHPRGMLGKKHSTESRAKIKKAVQQRRALEQDAHLYDATWLANAYENKSAKTIAKELGCSSPAVIHNLREAGVTIRKRWERPPNHKVVSVKNAGYADVYDMEVDGTHNFVANGVFVHNSGKSTFFSDAATWCLYGKTVSGLRTTDVRSWLSKKPPRVALTLHDGERARIVQRGPKASVLTVDGEVVGQADVDALVGITFEAWSQAVVWGQGQPLFYDLAPRDKMQLLSDALGLERWERRADAAGARARRLEDALRGAEGELAGLGTALEAAQAALGAARDASERWAGEQAAKVEKNASTAALARKRADALAARRGEAALAADSAGTAAKLLRPEVGAAREELNAQNDAAREAVAHRNALKDQLARVANHLEAFSKVGVCPTCAQPVGKKDAEKHARALRAEQAQLNKDLTAAARTRDRIGQAADAARATLAEVEARLTVLDEQERIADGELRSLERELATVTAEKNAAVRVLEESREETNPHREAASRARGQLRDLRAQEGEIRERATKLAASIERAQFWARGFRDIRLGIVDEVLDDLRETTATVLEDLGLGEWAVAYATERETKSGTTQRALHVGVHSPAAEGEVRWESYSGGERQRLRLAGALALSEVLMAHAGTHVDFRVLDEPTRGLSREGVRDLVEMLGAYAEEAELRVMYVDHTSEDGLAFASTITIVNDAGGARIEAQARH